MDSLETTRKEYTTAEIIRPSECPFSLFRNWYEDAETAPIVEPNAMALATVDGSGQPHCRMVLLKGIEDEAFRFYTNYESRKAEEISANARVSLCFYWDHLERQVRIEGVAEKLPESDSSKYFAKRPRGAQIGAWVSNQSSSLESYDFLLAKQRELEKQFAGTDISRPDQWGGYSVKPTRFEFWKGVKNRIHIRREYTLEGATWRQQMLQP